MSDAATAENPAAHSIASINALPPQEKRAIYTRLIPGALFERFQLPPTLITPQGEDLLRLGGREDGTDAEMALYHQPGFPDPILYGHITDTLNGHVHVLLYILNDPTSPRFDVDRLPDGTPTQFGIRLRNLEAEAAAMRFGLAPGQIRRGLRLLGQAIQAFEAFIASLGHEIYFNEPLYYHNAVIFERYGFAYQKGRRLMERIHQGFAEGGDLRAMLDGSTPFRQPQAADSIRLRSWALHDRLLGEPFSDVTMYKRIGVHAGVDTCPGCEW
jgi:acetoin utilization protein AcuC